MQRVIERARIAIGLFCAISILGLPAVAQSPGVSAPAGGGHIAIDGADITWKAELERPAGLVKVEAPQRILVEGAAAGKSLALAPPPQLVLHQAPPRILVEGAATGKSLALAPPPQLVLHQAPPRILVEGAATGKSLAPAPLPELVLHQAAPRIIVEGAAAGKGLGLVSLDEAMAQSALRRIEEAREAIAKGIAAGVDMGAAEAFLSQAEDAWQAADYARASTLAGQAKTTAGQIISALQQINKARETIAAGIAAGVDMGSAEALLAQAEEAWEAADYARASTVAEQAKTAAGQIKREAESAAHRINQAREAIAAGKLEGFNVDPAQSLLSQAEQALRHGDHANALEIAGKAISLAIDVDQDGIPNYRDFAPTINNNHIYIGAVGAFVLLVFGVLSISSYSRKKRSKREEIERQKKAEREEIERRKRAILEMIDEVVN